MKKSAPWFKPLLDSMIKEMLKKEAITGAAVEANPVWGVPDKLLISKVWDSSNKRNFIWTITGDEAVTDHIPGSLAVTAQEAALHFSYKWQMDADRLLEAAKAKSPDESSEAVINTYAKKLIQNAESLYDLASRDDVWKKRK